LITGIAACNGGNLFLEEQVCDVHCGILVYVPLNLMLSYRSGQSEISEWSNGIAHVQSMPGSGYNPNPGIAHQRFHTLLLS
jgi:hypothetical protein